MTKELKARLQASLQDVRKDFEDFQRMAGEDSFQTTKLLAIQEALESIDGTLEKTGTTETTDKGKFKKEYKRMNLASDTKIIEKGIYERAVELEISTGKGFKECIALAKSEVKNE